MSTTFLISQSAIDFMDDDEEEDVDEEGEHKRNELVIILFHE